MKNKYNAIKTEYEGDIYDSKKEAHFAMELDMLKNATDPAECVVSWERQVRYDIRIKGTYIAFYKLDFRVTYANRVIRNYDVKGYKKGAGYSLFRLKKKLVQALYDIEIEEV